MATTINGKMIIGIAAISVLLTGFAAVTPKETRIAAAIARTDRPDTDRLKDLARHPSELLALIDLRAGQTVADIWPGDYWDRLFSDLVGPVGKVYSVHFIEGDRDDKVVTPADGSSPLAGHANVIAVVSNPNTFTLPAKADVIWIRQNYHDLYNPLMGPADVGAFNRAVFKALKPGGRFVIIDHVAAAGSKLEATNTTHRIDPAVVKADMAAAGFRFVGESNVLRNPADPHTGVVFEGAIRGQTDQFVYVFKRR